MSKRKDLCNFTKEVAMRIAERDGDCIFCKMRYHMEYSTSSMGLEIKDCMHYINKSQNGLGIEENGVLGCRYHHSLLDNGSKGLRPEMLEIMKKHLKEKYSDWSEEKLIYSKWDFLQT